MTFEPGKEYKVRRGYDAKIWARVDDKFAPLHGSIRNNDGHWFPIAWAESGAAFSNNADFDLMPPEPEKITRWFIIHDNHGYQTRDDALRGIASYVNRSEYAIISITFHRGEGLE